MNGEMMKMRDRLVSRYGAYGRVKWAWLMQKYGVMPWDAVPEAMRKEVYS